MKNEKEIREFILAIVSPRAQKLGVEPSFFQKDPDLLKTGLLDSISFIELIGKIESHFHIQIDFEKVSPNQLASVSKLVKIISSLQSNA